MKHKGRHRVQALILVVIALSALTCLPVAALTPRHTASAAYKRSTYYQNLKRLPLTGDGAFDTLSVALSQYGYHEGGSTADLGGTNRTSTGNYTEYNYALGKVGGTYGYAWCASFVSFCLSQAGEAESAGGLFASCTLWVEKLRSLGQYRTRSSGYSPVSGDLIFFRSKGVTRASDHVGLVRYVQNGRVYTVEGNASGQVMLRSYALGDSYVVGYGCPQYKGARTQPSRLAAEDTASGYYVVSYDRLNLRAAESASAQKRGELARGEVFLVLDVHNGWGRVEYGGKSAYVSLTYADFVAPVRQSVRYESEGVLLLERSYYSTESRAVSSLMPEREGYRFLYWEGDGGAQYTAGEALPVRALTLTARFEEIPAPPVTEQEEAAPLPPREEGLPGGEVYDAPVDTAPVLPDGEALAAGNTAAAQHAGVISAILALSLGLAWLTRRREV